MLYTRRELGKLALAVPAAGFLPVSILPAIHIYKIWGGQMHEIEAMGIVLPYMSPTGWEQ